MSLQRSGYHPPNETVATHSRRRYRLLPPKVPNPNLPPVDPSLYIVHYSRAAQNDHIPAQRIPITPAIQTVLAQRRMLQGQAQLVRKDFMLHDRNNWPSIPFPPQMGPQGFAQPQPFYGNAMPGRPGQPPVYYPPHQPAGQPAKAGRGHRPSVAAATADFALEDEEVSTGDMLDHLTPREISKMRYQQHHEWMEEIFASPFRINQIIPVDLGLGRKGELEELTAGFFDAPVAPGHTKDDKNEPRQPPKIEPAKAEEFADRVAKKVSDMTAEIEKMKKRHARRMNKISRLTILKNAELRLRDAAADPNSKGPEIWRLEGRIDTSPPEEEGPRDDFSLRPAQYKVDDVVKELQQSYGRNIALEPNISCVEKGGLLERIEPETDALMDTSLLDQFVASTTPTPGHGTSGAGATGTGLGDGDTEMGGTSNLPAPAQTTQGETGGDWVMVNDGTNNNAQASDKPAAETTDNNATGLETSNFDDATNFTNMDSAGDALAAYEAQNDGLDIPELENSAFGDAFHAPDHHDVPAHHHEEDEIS